MPDRMPLKATDGSAAREKRRKALPETVVLVGGAMGVAVGMGLVLFVDWALGSACFRTGMAWGSPVLDYSRSGALVLLGVSFIIATLILLLGANNEAAYRLVSRMWWAGLFGLGLVALSYPLAGLIGCVVA